MIFCYFIRSSTVVCRGFETHKCLLSSIADAICETFYNAYISDKKMSTILFRCTRFLFGNKFCTSAKLQISKNSGNWMKKRRRNEITATFPVRFSEHFNTWETNLLDTASNRRTLIFLAWHTRSPMWVTAPLKEYPQRFRSTPGRQRTWIVNWMSPTSLLVV